MVMERLIDKLGHAPILYVYVNVTVTEMETEMMHPSRHLKQECIPVGCVPPACYRMRGLGGGGLRDRDPLDRDPPDRGDLWCMLGQRPPL